MCRTVRGCCPVAGFPPLCVDLSGSDTRELFIATEVKLGLGLVHVFLLKLKFAGAISLKAAIFFCICLFNNTFSTSIFM
jgi:hypothetical protein